jgi:hypothetical protein
MAGDMPPSPLLSTTWKKIILKKIIEECSQFRRVRGKQGTGTAPAPTARESVRRRPPQRPLDDETCLVDCRHGGPRGDHRPALTGPRPEESA